MVPISSPSHQLAYRGSPIDPQVVRPFLECKKQKTLIDRFLLGDVDALEPYLDPPRYSALNTAERAFLATALDRAGRLPASEARKTHEELEAQVRDRIATPCRAEQEANPTGCIKYVRSCSICVSIAIRGALCARGPLHHAHAASASHAYECTRRPRSAFTSSWSATRGPLSRRIAFSRPR